MKDLYPLRQQLMANFRFLMNYLSVCCSEGFIYTQLNRMQ